MRNRLSLKLRGALVVAATAIIAAVVSCGSLTGVPASLSVVSDSGVIYALNGAPSGAPTAVHFFTGSRTPADASFLFDVAFDIDTAGNPVLLPQRAVASGLTSTHSVGLQKTSTAFDQIASAPKTGYRADTAMVVTPGQAVLVQVQDPTCSVSIVRVWRAWRWLG